MSHRKATVRLLATALLKYQRITTTLRKAKEARRLAEKLISFGRRNDLEARRRAFSILTNRDVVERLFKDVAPLFKDRTSGFTRIIPTGFRRGDGASMAIVELTEKKIVEKAPKKKKAAPPEKEKAAPETEATAVQPSGKVKEGPARPKGEPKHREGPKPKAVPKSKPTLEEERAREKAKTEGKRFEEKKGGFLKQLRGRFRKRGTDT